MEWLNYHHLLYFWATAREGSIAAAGKRLLLSQPTISGQIHALEDALGEKLFAKSGRGLVLTDVGRVVYSYADEIFSLGRELQSVLKGRPHDRPARLNVGISDALPKLVVYRLLKPAFEMPEPLQITCYEDKPDRLIADLSSHLLDIVLSDSPLSSTMRVRAYSHPLGSCGITIFGKPQLASKYRKDFPKCLDGAPMLLPLGSSNLRRQLDQWFDENGIRVRMVAEFQDSALIKVFGQQGLGLFPAPSAIENEVKDYYRVATVGRIEAVKETFYAISVERKLKNPAVIAISESARHDFLAN
jgi:LysR family transcriptional activator of nhaA